MFKTRGGVKGCLNNVQKNCTIGIGRLPLLLCNASLVQYVFVVESLVLCIVSYIAQACYRSGASTLWEVFP